VFTIDRQGHANFSSSLSSESGSDNYLCIDPVTFEITNGGADCGASSMRFKTDIQDLPYGLADVLKLHPVTYRYREDINPDTRKRVGLVAEEVYQIIPEVVTLDLSGQPESVAYDNLVSLLIKAIQELNAKVDTLLASAGVAIDGVVTRFTEIVTGKITTDMLCVGETCLTEQQVKEILDAVNTEPAPDPSPDPETPPAEEPPADTPPVEEPTITEEPPIVKEPVIEEPASEPAPELPPEPSSEEPTSISTGS
jgi:hypothetical protein